MFKIISFIAESFKLLQLQDNIIKNLLDHVINPGPLLILECTKIFLQDAFFAASQ